MQNARRSIKLRRALCDCKYKREVNSVVFALPKHCNRTDLMIVSFGGVYNSKAFLYKYSHNIGESGDLIKPYKGFL